MRKWRWVLWLLAILIVPGWLSAQVVFDNSENVLLLKGEIQILEDSSGELTFDNVLLSENFKPSEFNIPNLGISSSVFWLKFELENRTDNHELLIEVAQPILDHVSLYYLNENGVQVSRELGIDYPFYERDFDHQNFLFETQLKTNGSREYYIRLHGDSQLLIPIKVGTKQVILEALGSKDLLFGLYFGIITVMIFYNLFIFFSVRDRSYLIYVLYILVVGLIQAALMGYTFKYVWYNNPWMAKQSIILFPAIGGILAIEFMKIFTRTKEQTPRMHWGFIAFNGLFITCITISISGFIHVAQLLLQFSAMSASLYMVVTAIVLVKKGSRSAVIFLIAWLIFLLGIIIYILKDIGVIPYTEFTQYILQIGSALEVILLSFGLADRINILQKEKSDSQERELQALLENERIIREQNIVLETKVAERTAELKETNEELSVALNDLKQTQSQLVSAEKMASLGQLTAGIAHEINNPINFLTSSVEPLQQNINELITVLDKYDEINESADIKKLLHDIRQLKTDLDYDLLLNETSEIIDGIQEGANRTAEIVQGLRTFSHVDDIGLKEIDINDSLNSTLNILKGEINHKIAIERQYEDVPKVECYGGKMNQVFTNIINNAIQIIKANGIEKGLIRLETKFIPASEEVEIRIIDNGGGMTEEVKEKIFEPFFTTKDVGEGTGLGLSVVYGIIEKHRAQIKVESEIGKETSFIINLPIRQKEDHGS